MEEPKPQGQDVIDQKPFEWRCRSEIEILLQPVCLGQHERLRNPAAHFPDELLPNGLSRQTVREEVLGHSGRQFPEPVDVRRVGVFGFLYSLG
jgi:hypothetical protein